MKIDLWIDHYSNCGTKIKTASIKAELKKLQEKYPEKNYELIRTKRLWFIAERELHQIKKEKRTCEKEDLQCL